MGSPENILLRLEPGQEAYVREIFAQLEQMGFPVQEQTPHISLTFAQSLPAALLDLAQELLPSVIPAQLRRIGTVTFGIKRKQTVAWLLEAPEELEEVARTLGARNPEGHGARWVAHLTMGLRLPREVVPDYIRALNSITNPHFREVTAQRAVYWRPQEGEEQILA